MNYNDKVYIISEKRFGYHKGFTVSSGYDMYRIEYEKGQSNLYYPNDIINVQNKLSNSEVWRLIDNDIIPNGMILIDTNDIEFIFEDNSIQLYSECSFTVHNMEKGDKWIIDRIV